MKAALEKCLLPLASGLIRSVVGEDSPLLDRFRASWGEESATGGYLSW